MKAMNPREKEEGVEGGGWGGTGIVQQEFFYDTRGDN
jgi:hypothetical protein